MKFYNLLIEFETIADELSWNKVYEGWGDKVKLDVHICYCPTKYGSVHDFGTEEHKNRM